MTAESKFHRHDCNKIIGGTASHCNCDLLNEYEFSVRNNATTISNLSLINRVYESDDVTSLKLEVARLKRREGQLQQEIIQLKNRRHR